MDSYEADRKKVRDFLKKAVESYVDGYPGDAKVEALIAIGKELRLLRKELAKT